MTDTRRPSDLAEKMLIRMPEGMRDRIAAAASQSGRSMNAEVVARLEASLMERTEPFTAEQQAFIVQRLDAELLKRNRRIEEQVKDIWMMYHNRLKAAGIDDPALGDVWAPIFPEIEKDGSEKL